MVSMNELNTCWDKGEGQGKRDGRGKGKRKTGRYEADMAQRETRGKCGGKGSGIGKKAGT